MDDWALKPIIYLSIATFELKSLTTTVTLVPRRRFFSDTFRQQAPICQHVTSVRRVHCQCTRMDNRVGHIVSDVLCCRVIAQLDVHVRYVVPSSRDSAHFVAVRPVHVHTDPPPPSPPPPTSSDPPPPPAGQGHGRLSFLFNCPLTHSSVFSLVVNINQHAAQPGRPLLLLLWR